MLVVSLLAVLSSTTARAQAVHVAVPVWIAANECGAAHKFQATVNGKRAPVINALGPSSDEIILVVSDLTSNLSLIEPAKLALVTQISKLRSTTWVGLLRDQNGLHVLANPAANRNPVLAAIQTISNNGQPGLLETVASALSLANAMSLRVPVRVAVLYVTDGSIYSYREDYTNPVINQSDPYDLSRAFPEALVDNKISKLMGRVSSLRAPLFVVQLDFRRDSLSEAYQNGLQSLARATGGDSEICQSEAEIPDAISQMFSRITHTWLLTLAVPRKTSSDLNIHVSISCPKGSARLFWRTHFHLGEG